MLGHVASLGRERGPPSGCLPQRCPLVAAAMVVPAALPVAASDLPPHPFLQEL